MENWCFIAPAQPFNIPLTVVPPKLHEDHASAALVSVSRYHADFEELDYVGEGIIVKEYTVSC